MTKFMKRSDSDDLVLRSPFCRQAELGDVLGALQGGDCRAVFITSDTGMGASTILRAVAGEVQNHNPVLSIHGTPALSTIPYGVLAPFLTKLSVDDVGVRVNVLRVILQALEARRQRLSSEQATQPPGAALIIIDDANAVDAATAELVVSLVLAGTVTLVASYRRSESLPEPMRKLWAKGMAEGIELLPLTQKQAHDFCVEMLRGPVLGSTSWFFWHSAGGNPLLMSLVVQGAAKSGQLNLRQGVWVAEQHAQARSQDLKDLVRQQIRGLTPQGREALNLVALSEPVDIVTVGGLVGASAVDELLARQLVREPQEESGQLRLINPIYGEVIRELVPTTQSRLLHQRLMSRFDPQTSTPEAHLRRVSWALESGMDVADEQLLRAAIYACKLYQTPMALRLVDSVQSPEFALRARAVKARARFNLGDYEAAAGLLDVSPGEVRTVKELLFGSLLMSATHTALGHSARTISRDAAALRAAGERLATALPEASVTILTETQERANVLELIVLSRQGDYAAMPPLIDSVCALGKHPPSEEQLLNRSVALALDAERLTVQGYPVQAQARAEEAFNIVHAEDHHIFFLPEMIIIRQLCAVLCAGDWDKASKILEQFTADAGPVVLSFGGGFNVVLGMVLIRQGKLAEALQALLPGMDALTLSDPQQLLGFCTSMAFYAAAKLGIRELAQGLSDGYSEKTGMFLVAAHERAFMAAGLEYLLRDGAGLTALRHQGDEAHRAGLELLELNSLYLALELGEITALKRFIHLASRVEGDWAGALKRVGLAIDTEDVYELLRTGELLLREGWIVLAHVIFVNAASVQDAARSNRNSTYTRKMIATSRGAMGTQIDSEPSVPIQPGVGIDRLTKRENEVIALAAAGHADREIAATLHVSIRTVEGHLYRAYAKLGITGRSDLSDIMPNE